MPKTDPVPSDAYEFPDWMVKRSRAHAERLGLTADALTQEKANGSRATAYTLPQWMVQHAEDYASRMGFTVDDAREDGEHVPFDPPDWMVQQSQKAAETLSYTSESVSKTFQGIRNTLSRGTEESDASDLICFDEDDVGMTSARIEAPARMRVLAPTESQIPDRREHQSPIMPSFSDQHRVAPSQPNHQRLMAEQAKHAKHNEARSVQRTKLANFTQGSHPEKWNHGRANRQQGGIGLINRFNRNITSKSPSVTAATPVPVIDHSPSLFISKINIYNLRELPDWYKVIKDSNITMMQLSRKRPQSLTALDALKNCVERCESEQRRHKLSALYDELRDHVYKAEITLDIDKYVVKKSRILQVERGLPRVFMNNFPIDLRSDTYHLYNRWVNGDFSQDILRGIQTVKGKDRNGDRLDLDYRRDHPTTARYYGQGALSLGQWWPTQLCAVRDGGHGSSQGGIFGGKDSGAYSIVLSGGGYHDKDEGEIIEYSGTDGKDFKPTDATLSMVKSAELGNVIRVIRSSQLKKANKYRPVLGLRYDGLYVVKSFKILDLEKQIHRFELHRCAGQEPIRYKGKLQRPTWYEIENYKLLKEKVW